MRCSWRFYGRWIAMGRGLRTQVPTSDNVSYVCSGTRSDVGRVYCNLTDFVTILTGLRNSSSTFCASAARA
eukprot:359834-Chlamydomonas_euryale.AAC.4